MNMQILEIVLFKDDENVRSIKFKLDAVNIVTGASKTGKTSLIDIVEYCFGSGESLIAEGVITDTVKWYGLLLQLPKSQLFIARAQPKPGKRSSAEIYFEIGKTVAIPKMSSLKGITNPDGLTEYLNGLIGIKPNLHVPDEGQTRPPLEASIRHALIFNFQRQDEIANRKFLFHKQGDPFVPQAIKDTFPYFLGAVAEDYLSNIQKLRQVRSELRLKERQLQEVEDIQKNGMSKAKVLEAEAESLGMIPVEEKSESQEMSGIEKLKTAVEWLSKPKTEIQFPESTLSRLQEERQKLIKRYQLLQDEIKATKSFDREKDGFAFEVVEQQARLESVHIFPPVDDHSKCPLCNTPITTQVPQVNELKNSLATLSNQLDEVVRSSPKLRTYLDGLEQSLSELKSKISNNKTVINDLIEQDKQLIELRDLDSRRSLVAGRISLYLESVNEVKNSSALKKEIEALKRAESLLSDLVDGQSETEVLNSILNLIGKDISDFSSKLELEHAKYPLRLDLGKLSVVADTERGPISMERMGSGENWVGYHLIVYLALHSWFKKKKRPVPSFLFFDQPTQVYYPPDRDQNGTLDKLKDEDRLAVNRMFKLIFDVTKSLSPGLQVIITDHADINESWFKSAVVERWRNGEKLIPTIWYE